MKIATFALVAALAISVGCQSADEKRRAEQREFLQKMVLFQRTDTSGNKLVSLGEFKKAFEASGRKSIDELFRKFDLDGNGVLTQKEWMQIK